MQTYKTIDFYDPLGAMAVAFNSEGFEIGCSVADEEETKKILRINGYTVLDGKSEKSGWKKGLCKKEEKFDILIGQIRCYTSQKNFKIEKTGRENQGEILEYIKLYHPLCIVLESRKNFLKTQEKEAFLQTLKEEGYDLFCQVVDINQATGIPIKETRTYIVAFDRCCYAEFKFPENTDMGMKLQSFLREGTEYIQRNQYFLNYTEKEYIIGVQKGISCQRLSVFSDINRS